MPPQKRRQPQLRRRLHWAHMTALQLCAPTLTMRRSLAFRSGTTKRRQPCLLSWACVE